VESAEIDRLLQAVKLGDRESYGAIVAAYQQPIFNYCCHMLGQLQEAEDVAQDVFVKGFIRLSQYKEGTSFKAWLFKIACHECLNRLKRKRIYERLLGVFSLTAATAHTEQPDLEPEINTELRHALLQIKPIDRHIILQRIVEENRFEDIAEQLDMSYAAVRKRYERARKQLQHFLIQKEDDEDERSFSY